MKSSSSTHSQTFDLRFTALLAVLVLLGGVASYCLLREPEAPKPQDVPVQTIPVTVQDPAARLKPRPVPVKTGAVGEPIPEWENKISDLIVTEDSHLVISQKLLAMIPTLPEEGQVQAAQHAMNLLPDENFNLAVPLLVNTRTPEAVQSIILADLLNRPNPLKLPTLLKVVQAPNHPLAAEARSTLEVFVGEDFGNDWNKWQAAVTTWLKENP